MSTAKSCVTEVLTMSNLIPTFLLRAERLLVGNAVPTLVRPECFH